MPEVALIRNWGCLRCVAIAETCYHGVEGYQVEADYVVVVHEWCNMEDFLPAAMEAARYDAAAAAAAAVGEEVA